MGRIMCQSKRFVKVDGKLTVEVQMTIDLLKMHLDKIEDGIERDEFGEAIAFLAQDLADKRTGDTVLKEFGWKFID